LNHAAEEPVANAEPIKRQRRWAADSGKVPERQPLSQSGSDAPKDIFQPALRRSFGRSDSTASGDSPKERIGESLFLLVNFSGPFMTKSLY
jgi:apoptotic chromatin condensation inducer in the nucleus